MAKKGRYNKGSMEKVGRQDADLGRPWPFLFHLDPFFSRLRDGFMGLETVLCGGLL